MPEFLERPAWPDEKRLQFADTVTLTTGNHTIKFGGDINRAKAIANSIRFLGGEFSYSGGTNALGFNSGLNDFIIDYTNFQNGLTAASAPSESPQLTSAGAAMSCTWKGFHRARCRSMPAAAAEAG